MATQAESKTKEFGKFLKCVRSELKKVIWPNKEELKNHTVLVIISVILATVFLWVLDMVFGFGLNLIIG